MTLTGVKLLTKRERDVARCLAHAMNNKEIAKELSISPMTVQDHINSVRIKTGQPNRVGLGIWAYEAIRVNAL